MTNYYTVSFADDSLCLTSQNSTTALWEACNGSAIGGINWGTRPMPTKRLVLIEGAWSGEFIAMTTEPISRRPVFVGTQQTLTPAREMQLHSQYTTLGAPTLFTPERGLTQHHPLNTITP